MRGKEEAMYEDNEAAGTGLGWLAMVATVVVLLCAALLGCTAEGLKKT